MALNLVITDVGLAALTNAQNNGTDPIVIAQIAIGSAHWTPTASATALQSEIKRVSTISGSVVDDKRLHISIRDASVDAYSVGELGLITNTGVLFAVYSQPTDILVKASGSVMLLAADMVFSGGVIGALTVGDLGFEYPPASETSAGVVEFATMPECRVSSDPDKAVPASGLIAASGSYSKYVSVTTASYSISGNDMGALFIASASASAVTLPLLSSVPRVGAAYTFMNLKASGNVTITRSGSNTLSGVSGSSVSVVLAPYQSVTLIRLSVDVWAVIGSSMNDTQNAQIGIGCVIWSPCRALIPAGFVPGDGQTLTRANYPGLVGRLGTLPTVTEANWLAAAANRGSYSMGDGSTTFRVPDYNGKYSSDVSVFFRGDGGNADAVGIVQSSQNLAHAHTVGAGPSESGGGNADDGNSSAGSFSTGQSGGTEARPVNVAGIWCIRAY